MDTISKVDYLENPCRMLSIPYWKAKSIIVPDNMKILHHDDFNKLKYQQYIDEPYFRLKHDLQNLSVPALPQGFSLCKAAACGFAEHINQCYNNIYISESELCSYSTRPVYSAELWLAVKDDRTGNIVATGIAELDREIGEGVLEWMQVSKDYRECGLGSYIVLELLWRMKSISSFVTVSGQCNNPFNPEKLYRKCGFTGTDVWHILKKQQE